MFSTYLANKVIDHFIRGVTQTPPAAVYLSLHTADPGATGASELPATNGYGRVNVTGLLAAASAKATTNTVEVTLPEAVTSSWPAATHAYLWDASSGGNPLIGGALTASKTAGVGVAIRFPVGDLDLALT
jgi:hypothetical protein